MDIMTYKNTKIVLASQSERRKEILKREGFDFIIYVPHTEEKNIIDKKYDEYLVNECAKEKALNAYKELNEENKYLKDTIIVSCDTIVVNDDVIIGKPKNKNDAIRIIKSLSGKRHRVISAVCVCKNGVCQVENETTYVTFRSIPDEEIEQFVEERKPYDKSGAYAIQDEKYKFAEKIEGSIDNVVGFPINKFKKMLGMIE